MTWKQQIDIEGQGSWTARRGGYGAKNCIHGNFVTLGLGHASPHPRFLLFRWTPIQFAFSSWISTTSQVPQLTWQCPFSKGHTTSAELPGTMRQLARECHCYGRVKCGSRSDSHGWDPRRRPQEPICQRQQATYATARVRGAENASMLARHLRDRRYAIARLGAGGVSVCIPIWPSVHPPNPLFCHQPPPSFSFHVRLLHQVLTQLPKKYVQCIKI